MTFQTRIEDRTATIGVVGLGYVGLPLALAYAAGGYKTIGFDIDVAKTQAINAGQSYIKHIGADSIKNHVESGKLVATTDFKQLSEVDAIILCVPTPLDEHFEPDLSYVVSTIEAILPNLRAGQTISLESTTYPGTTEEELVTRIESAGLEVGKDIFVVYSPEREDPGNPEFAATNIPKVVGGHTPSCLAAGKSLYGSVFDQVVLVSSTKVAELTKLLENIYRSVNIGLVNELKVGRRRDGHRYLGSHRGCQHQAVRLQSLLPRPRIGWPLHPNRSVLSHLEGSRVRRPHSLH